MPRVAAIVPWSARERGGAGTRDDHSPTVHLDARAYDDDPWLAQRGEPDASFDERARPDPDMRAVHGKFRRRRDGGMRQSEWLRDAGSYEESYYLGTYRHLADGAGLADYRARVTVTPEHATVVDGIGLMVRCRDPDNCYRLSQNARHGLTRFEKREHGAFSTLGVIARIFIPIVVGRNTRWRPAAAPPFFPRRARRSRVA